MLSWTQAYTVTDCERATSAMASSFSSSASHSFSSSSTSQQASTFTSIGSSEAVSRSGSATYTETRATFTTREAGSTAESGVNSTVHLASASGSSASTRENGLDSTVEAGSFTTSNLITTNSTAFNSHSDGPDYATSAYVSASAGATIVGFAGSSTISVSSSASEFLSASFNYNDNGTVVSSSAITTGSSSFESGQTHNGASSLRITRGTTGTNTASGSTTGAVLAALTQRSRSAATHTVEQGAAITIVTTLTTEISAGDFSTSATYTDVAAEFTTVARTQKSINSSFTITVTARTAAERVAHADVDEWLWQYSDFTTETFLALSQGQSLSEASYRLAESTEDTVYAAQLRSTHTITFNVRSSYTLTYDRTTTSASSRHDLAFAGIANSTASAGWNKQYLTTTTQSFTSGSSLSTTAIFTAPTVVATTTVTTVATTLFLESSVPGLLHSITARTTGSTTGQISLTTTNRTTYTTSSMGSGTSASSSFTTGSNANPSQGSSANAMGAGTNATSSGDTVLPGNTSHMVSYFERVITASQGSIEIHGPAHEEAARKTPGIAPSDPAYFQIGPGAMNAIPWPYWSSVQHQVVAPMPASHSTAIADVTWFVTLNRSGGLSYTTKDSATTGSSSISLAGVGVAGTGYEIKDGHGGYNEHSGHQLALDGRIGFWRETARDSGGGTSSAIESQTSSALTTFAESKASWSEREIGGRASFIPTLSAATGGVLNVLTVPVSTTPDFL